jgi:hypothetical protein
VFACAGPYGFEESVGAGGPYLTIVGILLVRVTEFYWEAFLLYTFKVQHQFQPASTSISCAEYWLACVQMPFFWSVPSAMMTAELATMMPGGLHVQFVLIGIAFPCS